MTHPNQDMTDQVNNVRDNIRYISPQINMLRISTRTHILQSSLGGTPSNTDWTPGSDSTTSFGGDE